MKNHTITVFDVQRGSMVDGPGIRTTVFFKGCNLRCKWCHNPESQAFTPELMLYETRCKGCGMCREVCPNQLRSCSLCGTCEEFCLNEARKLCGKACTVEELLDEIRKDRNFYETSGGGVTFSGGECMLQPEGLGELLKACKDEVIHTAVDTAGNVAWEQFETILPYTDLFLYDMKCLDSRLHREGTGVDNHRILDNLEKLAGWNCEKIIVRIPVITGFNAQPEEMENMAVFLRKIGVRKVELLPYHTMGSMKYQALGRVHESFSVPEKEVMESYRKLFDSFWKA